MDAPCRLMVDFPNLESMEEFVRALKLTGVIFEDAVLCRATPEDFNKKTGGVPRHSTAVLVSRSRFDQGERSKFLSS